MPRYTRSSPMTRAAACDWKRTTCAPHRNRNYSTPALRCPEYEEARQRNLRCKVNTELSESSAPLAGDKCCARRLSAEIILERAGLRRDKLREFKGGLIPESLFLQHYYRQGQGKLVALLLRVAACAGTAGKLPRSTMVPGAPTLLRTHLFQASFSERAMCS
jgi:hypothetical protein